MYQDRYDYNQGKGDGATTFISSYTQAGHSYYCGDRAGVV